MHTDALEVNSMASLKLHLFQILAHCVCVEWLTIDGIFLVETKSMLLNVFSVCMNLPVKFMDRIFFSSCWAKQVLFFPLCHSALKCKKVQFREVALFCLNIFWIFFQKLLSRRGLRSAEFFFTPPLFSIFRALCT